MTSLIAKLAERGLILPEPPKPGGFYDSVRVAGSVAYVAIQFPFLNGQVAFQGRFGRELTTGDGYQAAELCALNVLAQIHHYIGLERISALNMVEAHMQTAEGWDEFPKVLDGASSLFLYILGDRGKHARALYGVERLPMNLPISLTTSFTLIS